ncbi:MAG: hypothetical protein RI995_2148 [Bacteroidota bacterium]|jgi:hypothetical protein
MWQVWNSKKTLRTFKILFNLILWGMWIGLPLFSPVHHTHEVSPHNHPEFSEHTWIELAVVVPMFYFITLFLVPTIFKKHGVFWYIAGIVLSVFAFYYIELFVQEYVIQFEHEEATVFGVEGLFPIVMIAGIGSTYGLLLEFIQIQAEKAEEHQEQMQSELSFLRSQISPHFIFNVLNSIVYLVRTKAHQEAEDVTLKLSSLMRYMLYDSDQTMIPLSKELEYLKNYIDLQKTRFGEDIAINFKEEGVVRSCMIEPMLLIPFIENAFKHGVNQVKEPQIQIHFGINDGFLDFSVLNKIGEPNLDSNEPNSGIGLKNVKRRLQLLYPEKHVLAISDTDGFFKVHLTMTLDKKI